MSKKALNQLRRRWGSGRIAAEGSVLLAFDSQSCGGTTRPATRRHMPEDRGFNIPRCEKFVCHNELSDVLYLGSVLDLHRWFGERQAGWLAGPKQKQFSVCKNNDTENGSEISAVLPTNHIWLFYRTAMRICV